VRGEVKNNYGQAFLAARRSGAQANCTYKRDVNLCGLARFLMRSPIETIPKQKGDSRAGIAFSIAQRDAAYK